MMDARMLTKQALAGLATVALLAGCAAGATVAPSPTTSAPASPAMTRPSSPATSPTLAARPSATTTSVAGTAACPTDEPGTATTVADGYQQFRGGTLVCTVTTGDPRVSGTETASPWNVDMWGKLDSVATVQWGKLRLENAGGAWEGTGSGVYSSDRGDIVVSWFNGIGGYAGLGYFELRTGKEPNTVRGLIFPGDPPNPTGLPPVVGPMPSPNVSDTPRPVPAASPSAIAYGPASVDEGYSEYTYVDMEGGVYAGNNLVNDPRVSGKFLGPSWTLNLWGGTSDTLGSGTQWGASRIDAADGSWEGVATGILDSGGDVIAIWSKGTGAYAGLTYFLLLARPDLFGPNPGLDVTGAWGQVFPGDPPTP
jgi:hypothetical protein